MSFRSNAVVHTGTTSATVVGPNRDIAVTGIFIPAPLAAPAIITGLLNNSGVPTNVTLPINSQGDVFAITGEEGVLFSPNITLTLGNAADVIVVIFRKERGGY